jgi:hypothetical protein
MELALDLSPPEARHYRSWSDRLAAVARYSQPDEIHAASEMARAAGVSALLAVLDPRTEAALRAFQAWRDLALWAVVPNMNAFIRDLTDRGPAGAALMRFLRLRPSAMVATGIAALRELGPLARSDFQAGALWLAQMELAAASGLRIRRVFLHPQLTEIGLAGRVRGLFVEFAQRAAAVGMEAGLITHNPVVAVEVLGSEIERFAAIVSPCNPEGYKMVPSREACEAVFHAHPGRFWGTETTAAGSISIATTLAHAHGHRLAGAVLDVRAVGGSVSHRSSAQPPAADGDHAIGSS